MNGTAIGTPLLLGGIALSLLACGSFDDPTLDQAFDPATAEGPPERASVEFSATRNRVAKPGSIPM